jgi:hypothetical protein
MFIAVVCLTSAILATRVVYMCYSLLKLAPGALDLSQAEKRALLCKAVQIENVSLNTVLDEQSCHFGNLLSFT